MIQTEMIRVFGVDMKNRTCADCLNRGSNGCRLYGGQNVCLGYGTACGRINKPPLAGEIPVRDR